MFVCVALPVDTEDVCIVERLFSSSLVAIVSLKAPRKLKVCHFKKGTEICNYSYSNTILAVKLNRQVKKPLCNHIRKNIFLAQNRNRLMCNWLWHWWWFCQCFAVQRLIVCLEESLYIHNIRDMKVLHTIRETPPNPSGKSDNQSNFLSASLVATNRLHKSLGILNLSTK